MEACEVTVYCTVYNHEKYVGKCLESFINQKTSFRFSVIVHDDASTDRSTEIIREYAAKYPDIIVPIYQTENQYQQNVNIIDRFIEPIVKS
ncbi:MAG: glycosyltransferase, partial [Clostridia bacterium]|nr:glycosyltransferase [Clostridia bacterium]